MNDSSASEELLEQAEALRGQIVQLLLRLRRVAEEHDILPAAQMQLLNSIDHLGEFALPSRLAELLGQHSANIAATLKRLEESGLIMRRPDDADRRRIYVSLTSLGRQCLLNSREGKARWLSCAMQTLSPTELDLLRAAGPLLSKLAKYH